MAALTQDRDIWRREGQILSVPVKGNKVIFKGALVCSSAGFATPGSDTNGLRFCGVALESADNTGGPDGALSVRIWQSGVFPVSKPSATASDIGAEVAVVDDQTVDLLSVTTNDVKCGRIVRVLSSSEVELKVDGYAY
ncbi:MAG: hypothetical protein IT209_03140 [Armatimonadetes bacterium]|nr:hypothetical protein [Armatimonadota bacterium]